MIDHPTKRHYPRWGRATLQLVCAGCRCTIEDGERILLLPIGDGVKCSTCGAAHGGEAA